MRRLISEPALPLAHTTITLNQITVPVCPSPMSAAATGRERVAELRKARGISQASLARRAGNLAEPAIKDRSRRPERAQTSLVQAWDVAPQNMKIHPESREVLRVLISLRRRSNPQLVTFANKSGSPHRDAVAAGHRC